MMYCIPEWQFRMEVRSRVTDVILLFRNHTADIVFCSHRWWYRPIPHSSHFPIPQRAPPSITPAHTPHHTHFSMYPCIVPWPTTVCTIRSCCYGEGRTYSCAITRGKLLLITSNSVVESNFSMGGLQLGKENTALDRQTISTNMPRNMGGGRVQSLEPPFLRHCQRAGEWRGHARNTRRW